MITLLTLFPDPRDLLALPPEELGAILIEVVPPLVQNGRFNIQGIQATLYQSIGTTYPPGTQQPVTFALAEALSWLMAQGLLIIDPTQPALWYAFTRRAQSLSTRADVEAYRKARILPDDLLTPALLQKVVPLFRRGDHDIAVFQAFKEVEVTARSTANLKGAGYPDDLVGTALMRKAFHPETGPLTDKVLVIAEREAEMHLFSGAVGHAKNPPGHRNIGIKAPEAARLIIFASYLLDIIAVRA
jgi:hypothetical protein